MKTLAQEIESLLALTPQKAGRRLRSQTRSTRIATLRALIERADQGFLTDPVRSHELLRRAQAGIGRLVEPELRADLLYQTARTAAVMGHFDEGLALVREAAASYRRLGLALKEARTNLGLMHTLTSLARYEEALAAGLSARELFTAQNARLELAMTEENLGMIYRRLDDHRLALQQYARAIEGYRELGETHRLTRATANRAIAFEHLGQLRDARVLYETAIDGFLAAGQVLDALYAIDNLAALLTQQGKYVEALQAFERAASLQETLAIGENERPLIMLPLKRGHAYLALNLLAEAAASYEEAVGRFRASGLVFEEGQALLYTALVCHKQQRSALVTSRLDEAEQRFARAGNPVWQAVAALQRLSIEMPRRTNTEARRIARAAYDLFRGRGLQVRAAEAALLLAELELAAGAIDAARAGWQEVLDWASELELPQLIVGAQRGLARAAEAAGDGSQARTWYRAALERINDVRNTLPTERFRTAFLSDKLAVYEDYIRFCLVQGDAGLLDEAFQAVEAAKSRALLDLLLATWGDAGGAAVDPDTRGQIETLRSELTWYYNQLLADSDELEPGARRLAGLREQITQRERGLAILGRSIAHTLPAQHLFGATTPSVAATQAALLPGTQIVIYYVLDGEVMAFVIGRHSFSVHQHLCTLDAVNESAERLRLQLEKFDYGVDYVAPRAAALKRASQLHLAALYDLLVRPLRGLLEGPSLTVVPHATLHHVPFHALYDGEAYLVDHYVVSYIPSIAILHACAHRSLCNLAQPLLMALPDARIPEVQREVAAIGHLFPDARVHVGSEATGDVLVRDAVHAGLIHLATHALFRADNPLFSAIRLADRWISAREVYDLRLPGGLVTLSACESGISAVEQGDELLGLARGFFVAGAAAVVASLWVVNDATTATFMEHFYRCLREGDSLGVALRNAQHHVRASHPHPYYWAPFIVIGQAAQAIDSKGVFT